MAFTKEAARRRRMGKTRFMIRRQSAARLTVYRSNQHIYAQVISGCGSKVLASSSTLELTIRQMLLEKNMKKLSEAAVVVGTQVAQKALSHGVDKVAFDRSGYRYHGCVAALANAAREAGLQF